MLKERSKNEDIQPRPNEIHHDWYLIDATDKTLGRISSQVASILRGKNKPYFSPNIDTGDFVVVINAEKVALTGSKALQKVYKSYSGFPGGLKEIPFKRMVAKNQKKLLFTQLKECFLKTY